MGMFDTVGRNGSDKERKANTLKKLDRMKTALAHKEPDQVPVSDFFQSDHSVSSSVSGHTYDYILKLVREYGQYPLALDRLPL